jgi:hypothetical protein
MPPDGSPYLEEMLRDISGLSDNDNQRAPPLPVRPFTANTASGTVSSNNLVLLGDQAHRLITAARPPEHLRQSAKAKPMSDNPTREETREIISDKLAASEARTDTKFAQLIGRIETSNAELKGELGKISERFASLETLTATRFNSIESATAGTKATVVTTTILTAVGLLAAMVAILAYGQQWFGTGLTIHDAVRAEVHAQIPPSVPGP